MGGIIYNIRQIILDKLRKYVQDKRDRPSRFLLYEELTHVSALIFSFDRLAFKPTNQQVNRIRIKTLS